MTSATLPIDPPDVLVVGAGNAALCAAISAHENGARVLMLEAAPFEERGGNSHFTGGAFRFAFAGVDDLISVLPSLAQENLENVDFGTYTQEQFFDDLFALTQFRSDPDLAEILVRSSLDTARWVARQGVKLQPGLGRQAYQVDGKFKFWGGLALHIWGGGPELLRALYANVERRGIQNPLRNPGDQPHSRQWTARPESWRNIAARRCRSAPAPWCLPAAASSPIRKCGRAIWEPAGNSPRFAAPASTWAPA